MLKIFSCSNEEVYFDRLNAEILENEAKAASSYSNYNALNGIIKNNST
jgi:hypothetical protein